MSNIWRSQSLTNVGEGKKISALDRQSSQHLRRIADLCWNASLEFLSQKDVLSRELQLISCLATFELQTLNFKLSNNDCCLIEAVFRIPKWCQKLTKNFLSKIVSTRRPWASVLYYMRTEIGLTWIWNAFHYAESSEILIEFNWISSQICFNSMIMQFNQKVWSGRSWSCSRLSFKELGREVSSKLSCGKHRRLTGRISRWIDSRMREFDKEKLKIQKQDDEKDAVKVIRWISMKAFRNDLMMRQKRELWPRG